jgi:signal transduction histidine kinase
MAVVTTHPSSLSRPDGLAVRPAAVVRSEAMSADTEAKLLRAKNRLYVLCQLVGWGGLTGINLFYLSISKDAAAASGRDPLVDNAVFVMVMLQGLLLSHYLRSLIRRWGWKQLGWAALLPRVVGVSILASVLWSAVSFGYMYLVLQYPWTSKLSPVPAFFVTTVNGALVLGGWFCVYFVYHTFERLRHMQVEQLRLAASVKEAELRALKSQVNPHFLFNSLNSLRALIDEDAPKARESVTRLANMLRYSLQSGQQETVPLEEEIRIVEDYLALELIRHEDRLRVRWAVSDDARARPVPPMLLQTLVENAVKYGISTRREGGEVVISARVEADNLHIGVTNPGEVATPASAAAARAGSSTGVGLRNASERLQLLFGDKARLTLAVETAGTVTAHVFIPLKPAK